jgi:hypothetical protein
MNNEIIGARTQRIKMELLSTLSALSIFSELLRALLSAVSMKCMISELAAANSSASVIRVSTTLKYSKIDERSRSSYSSRLTLSMKFELKRAPFS